MILTLKQKHVANNCASQETEGFASIANSRFSVGEVTQSGNTGAWPWQKAVFCRVARSEVVRRTSFGVIPTSGLQVAASVT